MVKQQIMYSACIFSSALLALLGIAYGVGITKTTSATFIHFDEQIAATQKTVLTHLINQTLLQEQKSLTSVIMPTHKTSSLFKELKKELPGLTQVRINQYLPGRMNISLTVDTPLLKLNQSNSSPHILLSLGAWAPAQQYETHFLENLPVILITDQNFTAADKEALYTWVQHAPEDFFKNYSVCWNTKNDIVISHQEPQNFEYCCTTTTEYVPNLEKKLATLRELHSEKHADNKKKLNQTWCIDLRFKDQYIVTEKNNVLQKKSVTKGRGCV